MALVKGNANQFVELVRPKQVRNREELAAALKSDDACAR